MKNKILILGIDTFEAKNIPQIEEMNKKGYSYYVFTNDQRSVSENYFGSLHTLNTLIIANKNLLTRAIEFTELLRKNTFHHVELYAAGRMTFFYLTVCWLYKIKIITVERGDIGHIQNHGYLTRLAIKTAYKLSNLIWYKEPYMEELIAVHTSSKKLFFLPNAAPNCKDAQSSIKEIDFLWVNRFVSQRKSDWLINCLNQNEFKNCHSLFLGIQENASSTILDLQKKVQEMNLNKNTLFEGFLDPLPYYLKSRFFLLPSEIVFGNNSLLEAMSYGVVPIVSETESTKYIVRNMENGLTFEHNEAALHDVLLKALNLDTETWLKLSQNAIQTIKEEYSQNKWRQGCQIMYETLLSY
ncbi:MAG: glycosyltransferase [Ignavibacteriae bacterium]|nr:glycosyltransferase [Ignavibacteriota bacterium]